MSEQPSVQFHADPRALPGWFGPLLEAMRIDERNELLAFRRPAQTPARESAVLVLFGESDQGPDVLLIERAAQLRSHAGQPAFPGGMRETTDANAIDTALREASEETRLDPAGVTVVAELPTLWLPPSGFLVAPVIGWWREPSPVSVGDPIEVAAVHRVPVSHLVDPGNRVKVSHPAGYIGPGFEVNSMLVWGFTAMVLDRLLAMAGWELPWGQSVRVVPFDDGYRRSGYRGNGSSSGQESQ